MIQIKYNKKTYGKVKKNIKISWDKKGFPSKRENYTNAGGENLKKRLFGKEIELRTETVVIAISVLVLLGCLVGCIFFRDKSDIIIEAGHSKEKETQADTATAGEAGIEGGNKASGSDGVIGIGKAGVTAIDGANGADGRDGLSEEQSKAKEMIKVYVVGCVKNPGIVTLEKGQMIYDAVILAGGLTKEADADNINMVYKLNENVMLYIKSNTEAEQEEEAIMSENAVIVKKSGASAIVIGEDDDKAKNDRDGEPKLVNINSADIAELDTLPGIGEATARDIIAFREKNDGFRKIEDIMKVPRIKQARFESIKDYITVE